MKPGQKFSYHLSKQGPSAIISAHEAINEEFEIPVVELAGSKTLELDLSGVSWINSVGLRKFSQWLWEIENKAPNLKISLTSLSPVVVRQLNLIHNQFGKNITVTSVFVPFYCATCDLDDASVLVTRQEVLASGNDTFEPPEKLCRQCGNPMELDIIDNYFAILRDRT